MTSLDNAMNSLQSFFSNIPESTNILAVLFSSRVASVPEDYYMKQVPNLLCKGRWVQGVQISIEQANLIGSDFKSLGLLTGYNRVLLEQKEDLHLV